MLHVLPLKRKKNEKKELKIREKNWQRKDRRKWKK
jgi:hypothetical protein